MGVLDRFERRIETLVEGAFAKAFRAHVQPVEIAKAMERELDDRAAIVAQGRTLVPNRFVVELSAEDAERLGAFSEVLAGELATTVREHAAEQRYSFVGPISVDFTTEADLDTGLFRILSDVAPGEGQAPAEAGSGPRLEDAATNEAFALTAPVVVLGRGAEADIRVDDPGVSRAHAELRRIGDGEHEVTDLGSTNGTFVNGHRVARQRLSDGDRLELGGAVLLYRTAAG
ncbi:MAG: hypothetical protein QOE64_284 [Frankiales bacterium]|nr:hypothetical protein [Frankiales bacterium]